MKKSKIKILSLLLALILMTMTLGACGNETGGETGGPDDVAEKEYMKKEKIEREKENREEKISDQRIFEVAGNKFELLESNLIEDSDGDTDLVNTWKFTNNTKEVTSAALNVYITFMQKDQDMDTPGSIFIKEGSTDQLADYSFENVEPGQSKVFFTSYKLKDKESPVTIKISDIDGTDDSKIQVPLADMETVTVDALDVPE